jgi:chitodextrinase
MVNDASFDNYRIAFEIVPANRPVAVINASAVEGDVPLNVLFDSGGFGVPLSYLWDFGDGSTSTFPNPSHGFSVAGEYPVTLTVTDEFGRQTRQARTINATKPNAVPVAIGTSSAYSGNAPLDVVLSAAGSYDPDGVIGNVEWRFSDGGYTYGATAYHTFASTGTHTVTLLCYDARRCRHDEFYDQCRRHQSTAGRPGIRVGDFRQRTVDRPVQFERFVRSGRHDRRVLLGIRRRIRYPFIRPEPGLHLPIRRHLHREIEGS